MKVSDKIISVMILGLPVPAALALLFWWVSIPILGEGIILLFSAIAGFITGVILDLTVLRRHLLRLFDIRLSVLFLVMAFYSVMIYGTFMGFPAFNCLVGIVGAYIIARSAVLHKSSNYESAKKANRMNIFSFLLLLVLCITTAIMALNEATIGLELKSMLGLPFDVTRGMIWALIIVGGAALLFLQYAVSRLLFRCMTKRAVI